MHQIPVSFHFKVEFEDAGDDQDVRFQEVTGLSGEVTTEEFKEGGLNEYVHRLPTGAKYGNLVLKRGFVTDVDSGLAKWCRQGIEDFTFKPKELTVTLLNEEHEPLAVWSFVGAWPVKWSVSDLKAQDNTLAIESLEISYRRFRRG